MGLRESDAKWIFNQSIELWSWTGISWFVALFAGGWGVAIGIGAFIPAYICLGICLALCAAKWCHLTNIFNERRRIVAFVAGAAVLAASGVGLALWSKKRSNQAEEDARKLEPLKQIPGLVAQVNEIPGLKRQLAALPGMQTTIENLTKENKAADDESSKKEITIEELAKAVLVAQRAAADNAHKDLHTTQEVITSDIDQYRSDTTSAVGKLLRPERTLGGKRAAFVAALKSSGPHEFAITPARGNRESTDFANELEAAFKEAKWTEVPTQVAFIIKDGEGIGMWIHDWKITPLNAAQLAAGSAFNAIGMQLTGNEAAQVKSSGPADIYVGLQ